MEVLIVNSNMFSEVSIKALMVEDVSQWEGDTFIYGTKDVFDEIVEQSKAGRVFHLGFSPLPLEDLDVLLSLYSIYEAKGDILEVQNYEGDKVSLSLKLYEPLISYKEKNTNYANYISALNTLNNEFNITVPTYEHNLKIIKNDIEFDSLLISLYNYQYLYCDFKNISRGISNSLNNKTIIDKLYNLSNLSFHKGERWRNLKDCLDIYVNYQKLKNERSMIFFISFFISIASFNKNSIKSAISYSYLLRSVEVLCMFYLKKKGYITERNDRLYFSTDEEVNGVGPLLIYLTDIKKLKRNSSLFQLLEVRNCSFQGHGLYSPKLDKYNEFYTEISAMIPIFLAEEEEISFYNQCKSLFTLQSKQKFNDCLRDLFSN